MQEVFEKIIEKLERLCFCGYCDFKETEKIVKHAAAECKHDHFGCNSNGQHEKCYLCCDYDCKNRNREWFGAKDDNNGWIPCSERLPEENSNVIACFAHGLVTELTFYDGLFHGVYEYTTSVIIAWQSLPAPYHPSEIIRKKTNFDRCCESMEAMAQIIDIAKCGWTKEQIMEWLQKEECEVSAPYQPKGE